MKDIPELSFISKLFPVSHNHKDKDFMKERITRFIQPTIDKSEMETTNMIEIIEETNMQYLKLLSQRLDGSDKKDYEQALFDMRSANVSSERLKEAELKVTDIVKRFGKQIVLGDQLTV